MHNNFHFLKRLITELDTGLKNTVVSQVYLQSQNELIFEFEAGANTQYLKCDFQTWMSCLSLPENFARAKRNTRDVVEEMRGARVKEIYILSFDRIVVLELGNKFTVVFSLLGNRSNVSIYRDKQLSFTLKPKLVMSQVLDLEKFGRNVFLSEENFDWSNIKTMVPTLGPRVYEYFVSKGMLELTPDKQWNLTKEVLEELEEGGFYICKYSGEYHLLLFPLGEVYGSFNSAIQAINEFSRLYLFQELLKKEKLQLQLKFEQEVRNTQKYLKVTQNKLDRVLNRDSYKELADVVMANLHAIPKNAEQVSLFNFYQNKNVEITFKNREKPQKLAERYYRKSKNESKEIEAYERNIRLVKKKRTLAEENLEVLATIEDLKTLRSTFPKEENQVIKSKVSLEQSRFKEVTYLGYKILVGRNAKNNDELTLKKAKKNDLWLHAKDVSGSHVVIKEQPGKVFPKQVIEYAALLSAFYSKKKTDSLVPVMYTPKKFVRKPKGAAAGAVIVEKEKVILVSPSDLKNPI